MKWFGDWVRGWVPVSALYNLSLLTVSNFYLYLMGFLYGVFGARILGPESFGQLVLIIAAVQLIESPFDPRVGPPLIRLVREYRANRDPGELRNLILSAHLLLALFMVGFAAVFLVFLLVLPPTWEIFRDWQTALGLYAISEILKRVRIFGNVFTGLEWYQHVSAFQFLVATLRNLVPVAFMVRGVTWVCGSYILAEGLVLLVSFSYVLVRRGRRLPGDLWPRWDSVAESVRRLYAHGRSNYAAELLKKVRNKSLSLILGSFAGSSAVAYLDIGEKFKHFLRFLAGPLNSYLFPRFVDKWRRDREEFFYTLRKYFYQSVPLYVVAGGIVMAAAPWLLPLFYGSSFEPSVAVALVIVPAVALNMVFYVFRSVALAVNQARAVFNREAIETVLTLQLGVVLVYYFSYLGAAWAKALATYAMLFYQGYFFASNFGWRWIYPGGDPEPA